jgi:5-methylcytosine-specific restriction endonuclease McrA
MTDMQKSIRDAGRRPTVQQLVFAEQLRYWKENPSEAKQKKQERQRRHNAWRYKVDPNYRIYHREKSKRRKAVQRGSVGVHVTATQIRKRFDQFSNLCAYCGSNGDLHIEHVIPIAKGGNHVLGNIIPACSRCNYSKNTNPVEEWYRAQAFFCSKRWDKIKRILGLQKSSVGQMSLL